MSTENIILIILIVISLGIGFGQTLIGRFTRAGILEEGVAGKAKVLKVVDTGRRHNSNPVVNVHLSVATPDGAIAAEITQPLSAVRLLQLQPGHEVDVKYDAKTPSRVAIVFD